MARENYSTNTDMGVTRVAMHVLFSRLFFRARPAREWMLAGGC